MKRPRTEESARVVQLPFAERDAFLAGSIAGVMGATAGTIKSDLRVRREAERVLDFRQALNSVRELGGSALDGGRPRKALEAKKLASLGAHVQWKPQTMPYRMALGVNKKRKEREAVAMAEAREAGHGLGMNKNGKRAKAHKADVRRSKSRGEKAASDEPVPHTVRGPVMHVGK